MNTSKVSHAKWLVSYLFSSWRRRPWRRRKGKMWGLWWCCSGTWFLLSVDLSNNHNIVTYYQCRVCSLLIDDWPQTQLDWTGGSFPLFTERCSRRRAPQNAIRSKNNQKWNFSNQKEWRPPGSGNGWSCTTNNPVNIPVYKYIYIPIFVLR